MSVVKSYQLFINSAQRVAGTPNEFTVFFTPAYTLQSSHHFFQIRMTSCCIPYSFKQVNIFNNQFSYYYNSITPSTVVVPPGNYNILSLTAKLKSLIEADILANTGDTVVTTWAYDADTYQITFTFTSTTGLPGSTIGFPYSSQITLSKMLGWNTDHLNIAVGSSFISDQPVNVNPITSIYVRSDTLNQLGSKESLVEQNQVSDILAEIPVLVLPGSFIVSQNPAAIPVALTNRTIDKIQLYLSSSDNYALNLNNLDYTISFLLEEVQNIEDPPDPTVQQLADQRQEKSTQEALKELQTKREELLDALKLEREQLLRQLQNEQSRSDEASTGRQGPGQGGPAEGETNAR